MFVVWMTFAGTDVMTVGGLDEDDVGTILLAAAATVDLGAATVKLLPVVLLLLEVLPTRFPPARLRFESDCCRTCTFCSDVGITDKLL